MTAVSAPPEVLLLGLVTGLGYGLLAVGLVLAFRASRVINLAHGQVGALAAVLLGAAVDRWNVPYWSAFGLALVAGGLLSAAVHATVVRRLAHVPPVMTLVATLGVGQVLGFLTVAVGAELTPGRPFPEPPGVPELEAGALTLSPATVAMMVLGPLAVTGLWWLLQHSAKGRALRAAAANPDGARALGLKAHALAALAWGLAGALATLTAALVLPLGTAPGPEALGPSLLVRALAAAALAAMTSLPIALGAGVGIGVLEHVLVWNVPGARVTELVLFAVVIVALLARPLPGGRLSAREDWSTLGRWTPLPDAARAVPLVRLVRPALAVAALAMVAVLALVLPDDRLISLTNVAVYALVGLSIWLLIGLAGLLPLGQLALAAVGAGVAGVASEAGAPAGIAALAGCGAGALAGLLSGLPLVRGRGVAFAVTTLAFALAVDAWLLPRSWAIGDGRAVARLPGFEDERGAFTGTALIVALALAGTVAVARGRLGRELRAVRDNAAAARSFGVSATRGRLLVLALAGAIAGAAGVLLGQVVTEVGTSTFSVGQNVDAVALTVLGGLALASGPILGALYVVAVPSLVDLSAAWLATTSLGWLVVILAAPGGLAALAAPLHRWVAGLLLRAAGHDPALAQPLPAPAAAPVPSGRLTGRARAGGRLELDGLVRYFGGVRAVDGVSLVVEPGEAVGLVGANGAGKTSLFDLVSGLETPARGRVLIDGRDLTRLAPERRAELGLARTFQDGELFATLTVRETIALAGGDPEALVGAMGLEPHADIPVHALSTGTRRVLEIACLLAREASVLLLDEPTAGLAQPEAEALAGLLRRLREETGATMLIIEHDLPVIAPVVDRFVVMHAGRISAQRAAEAIA